MNETIRRVTPQTTVQARRTDGMTEEQLANANPNDVQEIKLMQTLTGMYIQDPMYTGQPFGGF
jgi:hypothetical protein